MSASALRVGFIGLGSQGGPMARRIVESGFPTTLWARRAASVEPYADTAAVIADSPAALAKASDVVGICVLDDAALDEVLTGPDGVLAGLAEGGVIIVHSTVHPETSRRLAVRAALQGVALVDAPVSGGGHAAAAQKLLVMASGEAEAIEKVMPVLETYGSPILNLGPVGSGQLAKLINNLLLTANIGVAEAAYGLGRAFGVDLDMLAKVFAAGSGTSFAAATLLGSGDHDAARMAEVAGPLLRKDARILVDLATASGADAGAALAAADAALHSMKNPR